MWQLPLPLPLLCRMILNNGRFGMGAATGGGLRKLISQAADYANNRVQFGKPISSYGLIQQMFSNMALDAFAIESMAYMTTALIDGPKLDMSVEAAICKIYGSEALSRGVDSCIQVLGGAGFGAGGAYPFERIFRDSRILRIFEGTNEILKLFVALTCLQAPGAELKELVRKVQQPATLLEALPPLLQLWAKDKMQIGMPAITGVTPALSAEAEKVGNLVGEFHVAIVNLLRRHGKTIIDQQLLLQRVADAAIDLYACAAVLSRATMAVSTKVEHQEHELLLARTFIKQATARIAGNLKGLNAGPKSNGDEQVLMIAQETLQAGKYLAEHPLKL